MPATPFTGIIIGAFVGGMCFVVLGLMRAVYTGGFLVVIILNKVSGKPVTQTFLVRIMVAAGIIVSVVAGIVVSMVFGGAVGGVIEYLVIKMT